MIPIKDIISRAGGEVKFVRALGFPVNKFTVRSWRRGGAIPEQYRERVAQLIGVDVAELKPGADEARTIRPYRYVAAGYRGLMQGVGLSIHEAARLHVIDAQTVFDWVDGYEEAPWWAFEDLYLVACGQAKKIRTLTVDAVTARLEISRSKLGKLCGVSPASVTYWSKKGSIPHEHAKAIIRLIEGNRPVADDLHHRLSAGNDMAARTRA